MKQKKAWSFFQSLGKAFMYPIALLRKVRISGEILLG